MTILINLLLVLEALVAILMMFVILMQRPKSEGLGAAFGGGVTENIFGAQTTNVLTTATTWLASIFFVLILLLSILYAHRGAPSSALRKELMKNSPPAEPATVPLPPKAAAKNAAADAKAKIAPTGGPGPNGNASTPSAANAAVGAIPEGAGQTATPSPATTPTP